MEFTHNNTRQATFLSLRSSLTQRIGQFINNNPNVFEALSRTGAPFGGIDRLMARRNLGTVQLPQDELAQIQIQLDVLASQVASLRNSLGERQERSVEGAQKGTLTNKKQIGIDRYRALQETAQLMA